MGTKFVHESAREELASLSKRIVRSYSPPRPEGVPLPKGDRFVKVHYRFVRALKGDAAAALVLAYVLNKAVCEIRRNPDRLWANALWFPCKMSLMQTGYGMTKHRVQRAIKTLTALDLIKTRRREGNVQWATVNVDALEAFALRGDETQTAGKRHTRRPETGTPDGRKPAILYRRPF